MYINNGRHPSELLQRIFYPHSYSLIMKLVDPTLVKQNAPSNTIRIGIALYTTENHPSFPLQWALVTDTSDHFESLDRRFYRLSNRRTNGVITPGSADVPRKEGWHLANIVHIANTNQEPHLLDTFFCTSPLLVPTSPQMSTGTAFRVQDDRDGNNVNEDWVLSALVRLHERAGGTFSLPFEPTHFPEHVRGSVRYLEKNSGTEDIPPVYKLTNVRQHGATRGIRIP